jgi:hypothetical protein
VFSIDKNQILQDTKDEDDDGLPNVEVFTEEDRKLKN